MKVDLKLEISDLRCEFEMGDMTKIMPEIRIQF